MNKSVIMSSLSLILLSGISRADPPVIPVVASTVPSSSSSSSSSSYFNIPSEATARAKGHIANEKYVIYGKDNGTIVSHNMDTRKTQIIQAHTGRVTCVSIARDFPMFVSSSTDKTAKVWTLNRENEWISPEGWTLTHSSPVNSANFNRDGSNVITSTDGKRAAIFSKEFGTQQWSHINTLGEEKTEELTDGSWVADLYSDGPPSFSSSTSHKDGHTASVIYATFSYDNSFAYTIQTDGIVKIWPNPRYNISGSKYGCDMNIRNACSIFCGKNPYLFFVVTKTNTVEVVKFCQAEFFSFSSQFGPETVATFQADSPIDFLYFNHDCSEIKAALSDGRMQIFSLDESTIQQSNGGYCSLS